MDDRIQRFDADSIIRGLKGFQRDTVEHVTRRFYGPSGSRRFLVADETGLGKSMVARGVIARTIEKLQDDDSIERIDIVYVCSNAEIARQNLSRLNVLPASDDGYKPVESASRLTLLAKHARHFARTAAGASKPVNLVSFTPGTSFDMGWQTGTAEERALLFLLLEPHLVLSDGHQRRTALNLLRGHVSTVERFEGRLAGLEAELDGQPDPEIARKFIELADEAGLIEKTRWLIAELGRKQDLPEEMRKRATQLIGALRSELARASVETLKPDLVILDEFQRFRNLLEKRSDAGQLAHNLFEYGTAKVLLLSATPYKPFSYAEEHEDDHYRDFKLTLKFLAEGGARLDIDEVQATFAKFRDAATTGEQTSELTKALRRKLIAVMSRNERSDFGSTTRLVETVAKSEVETEDLSGFAALRKLAAHLGTTMTIEYWKSAPYFVNFCDTYQIGRDTRAALDDEKRRGDLLPLLQGTQRLSPRSVSRRKRIDYGNARMRALADLTVDAGWWKLLWVPPSLPYLTPGGPYAEPFAQMMTKRLVFSSWAATPTAVASLLSHSAEHHIYSALEADTAQRVAPRLRYRVEAGQAAAMTTLALFWPMPGLAALADPRELARGSGTPLDETTTRAEVASRLHDLPRGPTQHGTAGEAWYWIATLCRPDSRPDGVGTPAERMGSGSGGDSEDESDSSLIAAHVERALNTSMADPDLPPLPPDLAETVASLALHSPANIAWRALGRIAGGQANVTQAGIWHAAVVLGEGLRSLFNRPESTLLLLSMFPEPNEPYWRKVLRYCAWGNLQAVLDEHLHHFYSDKGSPALTDKNLFSYAEAAAATMSLRVAQYSAFNPLDVNSPMRFGCRFALRYGGKRESEEDARMPEVREAFNSPFWPFVLATTSVGQEGIDFHRWSHSVVHWNTPANPVDFEQREGRVDRYAGHAIRRNLVAKHGVAILRSAEKDPWKAAFRLGLDEQERFGDFAPWWVYPGPAKIERIVMPYPLSIDNQRLASLKRDVELYRMTFGQPRQEDMLELLKQRYESESEVTRRGLLLDLRPPQSTDA
ncbi:MULTISPECIES: helicase-related protein [Rhodanobacter]|uniref:helicase-related protein n=1 Tax=Rhodanobacter TaxID=75309 RepID=UPI0003FE6286|nr:MULTISPECIES: helicase-related protein [Rhodanobacter]UJJ55205.1 DEAD/DEAH box helicase [Rhodanobacter thiooxydans]